MSAEGTVLRCTWCHHGSDLYTLKYLDLYPLKTGSRVILCNDCRNILEKHRSRGTIRQLATNHLRSIRDPVLRQRVRHGRAIVKQSCTYILSSNDIPDELAEVASINSQLVSAINNLNHEHRKYIST